MSQETNEVGLGDEAQYQKKGREIGQFMFSILKSAITAYEADAASTMVALCHLCCMTGVMIGDTMNDAAATKLFVNDLAKMMNRRIDYALANQELVDAINAKE